MTPREAADSVNRYVERTAIRSSAGAEWATLGYDNSVLRGEISVFSGAAGIAVFLCDYGALDLAHDTLRWCDTAKSEWGGDSLCFGRGGIALGWLHLFAKRADPAFLRPAREIADRIAAFDPEQPGVVSDYIGGLAGQGILLLRLHEATQDERYLAAARRFGSWLADHRRALDAGPAWPMVPSDPNSRMQWGFAHGTSGIAYFFVRLHAATGQARWKDVALEAASTLKRAAFADRGGLNWRRQPDVPASEPIRCQWCHGAPGVGLFFARAWESFREPWLLETAEAAGETTFAYGDIRKNPSQCHGLSGNAELLLELHRLTGKQLWLDRAAEFGRLAMGYRMDDDGKDRWQADEPGFFSPDFMCGAAGAGHFFLRLASGGSLPLPLM
jgi:lantibiotic modifying enzyme